MTKPIFYFLSVLALLLIGITLVTCKKEYSYEGGVLAQYRFAGSPNQCTNAIVNGTYTAGTAAVGSVNTVLLLVNITGKGNYSIGTEEIDGISFSASGNFPDTCSGCSLLLSAHGTPDSAGTFTFHIPGTTGCYFTVTVKDLATAIYTLSGDPNDCSNPARQGSYIAGKGMNQQDVVTINVDVTTPGKYTISTGTVNGFSFSASGVFTTPGAKQVTLQATGTPQQGELSQFPLKADASQCLFYIPVTNADPLATYVLQSATTGGTLYCAPGSVQGSYIAGTPLTSANTLTVNAYVTVLGNYTIATTKMDGMSFEASGTFTTIGAQNVVLKGSGTPQVIGTFTFVPQIVGPSPLGGSTCGLDVNVK